jgi:hypothetical protein
MMNQDERNQKIEEYGRGHEALTAALAEVLREAWQFLPARDEWSVHQIVLHMVDSESMGAVRLRKLIAEPGGEMMTYDDAKWGRALNYQKQNADDALELFKLTRQMTYQLLKSLPAQVFAHSGIHPDQGYPEYGEVYNVDKWLNIYTRHVRDHIAQIQSTHQAWKKQKT